MNAKSNILVKSGESRGKGRYRVLLTFPLISFAIIISFISNITFHAKLLTSNTLYPANNEEIGTPQNIRGKPEQSFGNSIPADEIQNEGKIIDNEAVILEEEEDVEDNAKGAAVEKGIVEKEKEDGQPVMDWRVVVSSNIGFEHVFLNWWSWFTKIGLEKEMHVVFIADDAEIYEKYKDSTKMEVKKGWKADTKFKDSSLTGDFKYGNKDYKHLVSRRPALVLEELQHGNVLYIDIDTVVREDPRPFFVGDYDMWAQRHKSIATGSQKGKPTFCTGFMALRSTENTKAMVEDWKNRLESGDGQLNQGIFNISVYKNKLAHLLKAKALEREMFPTGNRYSGYKQEVRDKSIVMHMNYCRGGNCKEEKLKEYGLWDPVEREAAM